MGSAPNGYTTPKTNWAAGDIPTASDFNRIEGNIQAVEEGSRTIDPAQTPSGNSGTLRQLLDWFANRIKAILGTTNWYDTPPTTLQAAKTHIDRTDNPHNVTIAQIGAAPASHTHPNATTSTAGFMSAADKSKLDGIENGATADMTAQEILDAIKTVDGSGSGLDADLLDGQDGSYFAAATDLSNHINATSPHTDHVKGSVRITVSSTAPSNPNVNDIWIEV